MKEHRGFNQTVPGCEAGNKTLIFEFCVDLPVLDAGLVRKILVLPSNGVLQHSGSVCFCTSSTVQCCDFVSVILWLPL